MSILDRMMFGISVHGEPVMGAHLFFKHTDTFIYQAMIQRNAHCDKMEMVRKVCKDLCAAQFTGATYIHIARTEKHVYLQRSNVRKFWSCFLGEEWSYLFPYSARVF